MQTVSQFSYTKDEREIQTTELETRKVRRHMLEPSLQEVAKQLKVFGGIGYKYTFQTFHDSKSKPEDARIIHSTFDDAVEELYDLNNKGHGVYISVNQTDLKGRKTENITGLRFLVLDEDKETVSKPFLKTPSMIEMSKNGRHRSEERRVGKEC